MKTVTSAKYERVDLTPERKEQIADDLAAVVRERNRLLDHKKNWVKETTEAIRYQEARMADLARIIEQGFELQEREV